MFKHSRWVIVLIAGLAGGWYAHQYWPVSEYFQPAMQVAENYDINIEALRQKGRLSLGKIDPFDNLLKYHQYRHAVRLYNEQESEADQERYKAAIIDHLNGLLAVKDYVRADQLLLLYLFENFRDVDVLLIRAELDGLQGNYGQMIEILYEVKSYEYRAQHIASIEEKIREIVARHGRQLLDAGKHQGRLALYERLVLLEPSYSYYFIELASAQLALNRFDEAWQSLMLVASDPRVSDRAHELLSQLDSSVTFSQPTTITIPLIRRGNHFVVKAMINNKIPVQLLLDTGASMTVVKRGILESAGVRMGADVPLRQFSTVSGAAQGPVYRVDTLALGGQSVANMEIAVLELSGLDDVDGLLGMNYLKHFKLYIDQSKSVLRLSEPLE